jgi:DNA-binding IclR family transcriptional regulator
MFEYTNNAAFGGKMGNSLTTEKVIKIIETLHNYPDGLTLSEIMKLTKLPKTTIYDIITTLVEHDFLVIKNSRLKNYAIGPKLFIYSYSYLKSSNLLNVSQKFLKLLANQYNKTGFIFKSHEGSVVSVYKYESPTTKVKTLSVGETTEIGVTAAGKIAIVFDEESKGLFKYSPLKKYTPFSITDINDFALELENIKEKGYAIDNREYEMHLTSVGAPIFDYKNQLAGILCLIGLYDEEENLESLGENVKQQAKLISEQLGYIENE